MKESKYNEHFNIYGRHFIVNTINNSICYLKEEDFNNFSNNKFDLISKRGKKELLKNSMLLLDNVDEVGNLKNKFNEDKVSKRLLDITIITSLDCNFHCTYCYENHNGERLNEHSSKKIIDFISSKLNENYDELLVTWYGGEPLLMIDLIYDMETKLNELCKKHNTKYNSYITTNGYLINKSIINKFKKMYLQNICITLDGNKNDHDSRRKLANGKSTFDQIVKNIMLLKENDINCVIRINIDKENTKDIKSLTNLIKNELKCNYYFAQVKDYSGLDNCDLYLSNEEYAKEQFNNIKETPYLPRILSTSCRAVREPNYIIDSNLNVYSCAFSINNKNGYLGNLKDNKFIENDFSKWDPFKHKKCLDCSILPYCMGGCILDNLINKSPKCMPIKYNYRFLLEEYIKKNIINEDEVIRLKKSILFRKEKDYILICDCKNLYDFTLSLDYYDLLCKLKEGAFKDTLTKEEKSVLKDFKKLNFLVNNKEISSNALSRIQYNESEFYK